MGSIKQEAQRISHNTNEVIRNASETIKSKFNSIIDNFNARYKGLIVGDTIGINVNEIPQMQHEIDLYVEELQSHLDNVVASASTADAFKGTYAQEVTEFVKAVKSACQRLIGDLLDFKKELQEVAERYVEKDKTVASNIRADAEAIK